MRFRVTIQLNGKTATGIRVPPEAMEELGGKRAAVRVTIGSYTYRSGVATMGGQLMLPVSAEVRDRAGVAAGDEVDVDIELDTEPREVTVPLDLADALHHDPVARRSFDSLSYSNKRRLVIPIDEAKTTETRQRWIARTIESLREGRS
jgi:bifunctional DNA-binding transcriptional regulator/antitoxin component of YhaV-PrlF toxin-antitoxin module